MNSFHNHEFGHKCEQCAREARGLHSWISDSGASAHITSNFSDFLSVEEGDFGDLNTASGVEKITHCGTVVIFHNVYVDNRTYV